MNSIQLIEPGRMSLAEMPYPGSPGVNEALVRVRRIGVCGTDIHAFGGNQPFFSYPRVLGHELGVEVLEIGSDVENVLPGDRCSVEPYLYCGACIACRRARPNCCTQMRVLGVHVDGGMCEYLVLPAKKLHTSFRLTYDQLALVETLGIGCHAVERAGLQPGENVLVIGSGPIGLAVMQFAIDLGTQVIVLDINESRLSFCREKLDIAHTINSAHQSVQDLLQGLTGGDLPTAVFDATGDPQSMIASFDYTAHSGRLIFVGLFSGDINFHAPKFHRRELTLLSSRNALPGNFAQIIRKIEEGRIDTTSWITHRAPFSRVVEQFPHWTKRESQVIKAMIEI